MLAYDSVDMKPINVLVVEDHACARDELITVVEESFSVHRLDVADSIASACDYIASPDDMHYDIAFVDLGLPDGNGITLVETIKQHTPSTIVIICTIFDDDEYVISSLRLGANGYLLKGHSKVETQSFIRSALNGNSPLTPSIASKILEWFRDPATNNLLLNKPARPQLSPSLVVNDNKSSGLTGKERNVLQLIAKGYTIKEVAQLLYVSANTVAAHVKSIYKKLGIHSRAEAASEAIRLGLLEDMR